MSGILVGERTRVGVEHRVEESYKLSRSEASPQVVCTKLNKFLCANIDEVSAAALVVSSTT